jgi:hypothetical protein
MGGFREHFLDKYFGYRSRYVAAVAELAPDRRSLAVLSEIARLAFSFTGSAVVAAIFWLLVSGASAREGGIGLWTVVFATLALAATALGFLAARGVLAAFADRAPAAPNERRP